MWQPPFDLDALSDEEIARMNTTRADLGRLIAWMREREARVPAIGGPAPEFAAERLSPTGERTGELARLSDHRGRPVALAFGSYT